MEKGYSPEFIPRSEMDKDSVMEQSPDVFIKNKILYHGSGQSGIESFNQAEEDTVGSGVYFTSEMKDAAGYAKRRARRYKEGLPVLYEANIENVKLLDLRKDENVKMVLEKFKAVLEKELASPNLKWNYETILRNSIEAINAGKIGADNLRDVTFGLGKVFSNFLKTLGYDGLMAVEGGEGEDVGRHDTYLIFDPEKIRIINEKSNF